MKNITTFNTYQVIAHSTSVNTEIHGDKVLYPALGIADEAGEVAGKFKKLFRDKGGKYDDEFKAVIVKEMGDVLWYLAETATQLGLQLEDIATANVDKLLARKDKGTIHGDGDNR
jgi:NTP pyrophosphatase (non-canonical NTP hydrolase)